MLSTYEGTSPLYVAAKTRRGPCSGVSIMNQRAKWVQTSSSNRMYGFPLISLFIEKSRSRSGSSCPRLILAMIVTGPIGPGTGPGRVLPRPAPPLSP